MLTKLEGVEVEVDLGLMMASFHSWMHPESSNLLKGERRGGGGFILYGIIILILKSPYTLFVCTYIYVAKPAPPFHQSGLVTRP